MWLPLLPSCPGNTEKGEPDQRDASFAPSFFFPFFSSPTFFPSSNDRNAKMYHFLFSFSHHTNLCKTKTHRRQYAIASSLFFLFFSFPSSKSIERTSCASWGPRSLSPRPPRSGKCKPYPVPPILLFFPFLLFLRLRHKEQIPPHLFPFPFLPAV